MRKIVIGVMGPGNKASETDKKNAFEIGKHIAEQGWILLTGGRTEGVMNEASRGAKSANGLTIGIIPTRDNQDTSPYVDIAVITGMGSARDNINVLSSDVVIACGMGPGTAAEVSLALKATKHVVLLTDNEESKIFFSKLDPDHIHISKDCADAISIIKKMFQ